MNRIVTRGFRGRKVNAETATRLPPGQYLTRDFPVLSAGPTPRTPLDQWDLRVDGLLDAPRRWSWTEFLALPHQEITVDIHCVTQWTKLDTRWEGVSLDHLLEGADSTATHLVAHSDDGYTSNLPLAEVLGGRAWVAIAFDGEPLTAEHGGPARLLVPHLYFWKSAKWIRRLELLATDRPGFWEGLGYHNHGDPWLEQRYQGD